MIQSRQLDQILVQDLLCCPYQAVRCYFRPSRSYFHHPKQHMYDTIQQQFVKHFYLLEMAKMGDNLRSRDIRLQHRWNQYILIQEH